MGGGSRGLKRALAVTGAVVALNAIPAQAAVLVAPDDGATVSPSPTVEWRLDSGESNAALYYSRRDDPAKPVVPIDRVFGATGQSHTFQTLAPGTYDWRITYSKSGSKDTSYSEIRSFAVPYPPLDKLAVEASRHFFDFSEFIPEESDDYLENSTRFEVEATPYAAVVLAVTYAKTPIYTATLRALGAAPEPYEESLTETYHWTCKRQGRHEWTVVAWDFYGQSKLRTGAFSPGRCGTRASSIRRRDLVGWIEDDFKPDEFVNYIRCAPVSKLTRHAAHAWRCDVRWNNLRRECGAGYVFRYYERLRFGQVIDDPIRAQRKTKFACRQFAG